MGLVQFSPELNQWHLQKELWRLVICCKVSHHVKATTIRRLTAHLHITDPLAKTLKEATSLFQYASTKYEDLKPNHEALRQSFLLARLHDPMISDAQQIALSHLVAKERVREAYRRIRALKGLPSGTSISQVEITDPQGSCVVSGQQAVEQALCTSLAAQFRKAHGSPFLHPPLLQDVGFLGCGEAAKAILDGSYQCPPNTDENTWLFIKALRWPTSCPDLISTILNAEAFCAHWQKARKTTSSSFSGLHFGHYKSAASAPDLAHLHARFTQLVFMTGISLSQYQSGLQVILEKKAGAININLL